MIIELSHGKLIVTPHEVQFRSHQQSITFTAMVDDMQCFHYGLMIVADAGAVRWSVKLDNAVQFEAVLSITQIEAQ